MGGEGLRYSYCNGQQQQTWYWRGDTLRNLHLEGWCLDHSKPSWSTSFGVGRMMRCNGGASQQWTTVEEYPDSLEGSSSVISAKDRYLPLRVQGEIQAHPPRQWSRLGGIRVAGRWVVKFAIVGNRSESICEGTRRTTTATRSKEWTHSVELSMGLGFKALGSEGSMTVPAAVSGTFYEAYTEEFELTKENCSNWTITPTPTQKVLWQWVFDVTADGLESTRTWTPELAMTLSGSHPPRCLPRYSLDIPEYKDCLEGYWLP